jgi:CheY-like chemotaxis protein
MTTPHALIIDDDLNNLKVLSKLLSLAGATYTAVQDSTQIVDIVNNLEQLDVVFLDLEMPNLDGYEILSIFKEQMGIEVPIVACTVHTAEINNARDLGFDSFLAKPLRADKFPSQLNMILSGEPVWDKGGRIG